MGIFIKDMQKPKKGEVIAFDGEYAVYTDDEMQVRRYPLIEIDLVRCSECMHLEVINKAPIYAHCHKWNYDFELWQEDTRANFCSWGERRE